MEIDLNDYNETKPSVDISSDVLSSNVDLNKLPQKAELTEDDIRQLNIPPRDETRYPMPSKEDIERAGKLLWKMNLLASSLDKNMRAIIWQLYVDMVNFLNAEPGTENVITILTTMNMTMMNLKNYLKESNNPVFKDDLVELKKN